MSRIARVVVPGLAYHVTHRGNRGQDVFFEPRDRTVYKRWLGEYAARYGLEIWAYCLMTNHVHLLVVARTESSLAKTIGRTHGRYASRQNRRHGWTGHLWANRYYSTPLDEAHAWAAVRYVERNPVRAGMVERAEDYPWSSARCHAMGEPDPLLSPQRPFPGGIEDWSSWLAVRVHRKLADAIRKNTLAGRPTGSREFVEALEARLDRTLSTRPRGRKRKGRGSDLPNRKACLSPISDGNACLSLFLRACPCF